MGCPERMGDVMRDLRGFWQHGGGPQRRRRFWEDGLDADPIADLAKRLYEASPCATVTMTPWDKISRDECRAWYERAAREWMAS